MKKFFISLWQFVLVVIVMAIFAWFGKKEMDRRPMAAYDQNGNVVAVEHRGKVYPSFTAAGLSSNCMHHAVDVVRLCD